MKRQKRVAKKYIPHRWRDRGRRWRKRFQSREMIKKKFTQEQVEKDVTDCNVF